LTCKYSERDVRKRTHHWNHLKAFLL